jgi:quercetin dioxygenase-like cupin family protein
MKYINDSNVEFKNREKQSGSKYLFTTEKYALGVAYIKPGDVINEHSHQDETELFYFVSGSPKFTAGGKEFRVQTGDAFTAEKKENHSITNDTKDTVKMVFIKIKD